MINCSITSWNIRGICNEVGRRNCRRLIKESQAQIILLQETKCTNPKKEFIVQFWESLNFSWIAENAIGQSGGLMSAWEKSLFSEIESFQSKHWIWLRAKFRDQEFINIANVYGPLDLQDKIECWEKLSALISRFSTEAVCLLGDFNCIRDSKDRENCIYSSRGISDFNEFISNNCLLEITPPDLKFSWFGPLGRKSKLDHVFVNDVWLSNQSWVAKQWFRRNSDHCPLSLHKSDNNWGPKSFKAFDAWLHHPDMEEVVTKAFNGPGQQFRGVFNSLKSFKNELKLWSINWRDRLQVRINGLEAELSRLDSQNNVVSDKSEVVCELHSCYRLQTAILKQKSRVQWLKEGDANSRFFHRAIQIRNHINSIRTLKMGGSILSTPEIIKSAVLDYFSVFFSEPHSELLLIALKSSK